MRSARCRAASALLLAADPNTYLYFQPATGFFGTVTNAITFRAWDQTTGTAGTEVDPGPGGGTSAFSVAADTANIKVTPLDAAPVLDLDAAISTTAPGSQYAATFPGSGPVAVVNATDVSITDTDNANVASATVTLTTVQTGDTLALNGLSGTSGTLGSGIGWNIDTTNPAQIVVTFTNSASKADYQNALQLIEFNTSGTNTTNRTINVVVNDGTLDSNTATSTVYFHTLDLDGGHDRHRLCDDLH